MATTEPDNSARTVQFNTSAKFIQYIIGSGPTDCCFKFPESEPKANGVIVAHRRLLAVLSPVFAIMFNETWSGACTDDVTITDASPKAFAEFLAYFYKGHVQLRTDNIHEITHLADKYWIDELAASCTTFAIDHVSANNVLQYYELALLYGPHRLLSKCDGIIARNAAQVLQSEAFAECSLGVLRTILKMPKMTCQESTVFDACVQWAKCTCRAKGIDVDEPKNLRTALADCFDLIRFVEMGRQELMQRYDAYRTLFRPDEIEKVFAQFIRTAGTLTNIRYTLGEATDDVVNFVVAEGFQDKTKTQVLFNLSQAVVLNGVSFPTPQLNFTYSSVNVRIDVQLGNERMPTFGGKTSTGAESCIMLPKPLLVHRTQYCFIIITLDADTLHSRSLKWQQWDSTQLIPATSWSPTNDVKSFILALRFQSGSTSRVTTPWDSINVRGSHS